MSKPEAAKVATTMLALAKIIAKKPAEQRRIVIRASDLKLLKDAKDEHVVNELRAHCTQHQIKFVKAKTR